MSNRVLFVSAVLMGLSGARAAGNPVVQTPLIQSPVIQRSATSQEPGHDAMGAHTRLSILSTTLTVTVPGQVPVMLSLADLGALPQTSVEVLNAHNKQNETYSGPLVADVLTKAGLTLGETTQHTVLDSYVVATGTDHYFVVFSGAELQPGLHKAQPIVAIAQSGAPLARTGAFQLIDPQDVKPARWVRNLKSLAMESVAATH